MSAGMRHSPCTVDATPEAARWRAGVGEIAASGTEFAPVDALGLMAGVLPFEQGAMRAGGESVEQFAEYHRSKRLAEIVRQAVGRPEPPVAEGGLTADTAATEFAAWLRAGEQRELPEDL